MATERVRKKANTDWYGIFVGILFLVFIGWWAIPIFFLASLAGDMIHAGETPQERRKRRKFESSIP